jgi:hypothetical protein
MHYRSAGGSDRGPGVTACFRTKNEHLRIDQLLQIDAALRLIPPEPTHASSVQSKQSQCEEPNGQ